MTLLNDLHQQSQYRNPDAPADAVIAMSGGQDSTTLLAWAVHEFGADRVRAIGFDYKQRHRVELEQAARLAATFGVSFQILPMDALAVLGGAALTNSSIDVDADAAGTGNEHAERAGLPSTFVPGRNLLFLGVIGAYAAQYAIPTIITGICDADRAGYPDCRIEFAESMEQTLNLAMGLEGDGRIRLIAPLLELDKRMTWLLAKELDVLNIIRLDTHTCYEGDRVTLHDWGYGCGVCGACLERASGYHEAFVAVEP